MTLTTEPHTGSDDPETGPAATDPERFPAAEAIYMDLTELIIDENVRTNFDISKYPELAESIRVNGIDTPIKAYRYPDGRVRAVDGQLRTLIALDVGRTRGPVWIEPAPDLTAKERVIARITEQITVNDHRIPLTHGDRAAGIADMLNLGVSVTKVAKSLAIRDLDTVRQAGRIGRSAAARTMLDENQLDLEQAAILADFDAAGDTAAVEQLQNEPRNSFLFKAHRITQERDEDRAYLAAALPYAAAGFAITMTAPETYGPDTRYVYSEELLTAEDQPLTAQLLHAAPDGWVVFLDTAADQVLVDRATGAAVESESVDWDTRGKPDTAPAEGLRHADTVEYRRPWIPRYYLPAPLLDASGYHLVPPAEPEPAEVESAIPAPDSNPVELDDPDNAGSVGPTPQVVEEVTAVDREADLAAARARAQEQRAAQEAAAREAKRLKDRHDALTKDFTAATAARIDFLTMFLARTTAPTSAQPFLLESLGVHVVDLTDYQAVHTALKWLGVTGSRTGLAETIEKARPGRCTVMLLALVFAAFEARISRDGWAHKDPRTRFYLHYLAGLGHHLTTVEQSAAGDIDPGTLEPDA